MYCTRRSRTYRNGVNFRSTELLIDTVYRNLHTYKHTIHKKHVIIHKKCIITKRIITKRIVTKKGVIHRKLWRPVIHEEH